MSRTWATTGMRQFSRWRRRALFLHGRGPGTDVFASLLEDIAKKRAAGAAVGLDIDEVVALLAAAAGKVQRPMAALCATLEKEAVELEERCG